MISRTETYVYFNSKQISMSVVSRRGDFRVQEYSTKTLYQGVTKSFFLEPNEIEGILTDFCERYRTVFKRRLVSATLVLPQHFFRIQPHVRSASVNGKVLEKDVRALKKQFFDVPEGYASVRELDGGYAVNGEGDFTTEVIGKEASDFQSLTLYVCLNSKVKELFSNIAKNLHVEFSYLPPCLPAVQKLNRDGKSRGLILLINQLSSDLIYYEGDLPVSSLSIPFGYLHFADYLSTKAKIPYEEAMALLDHVNLALATKNVSYALCRPDGVKRYPASEINPPLIEFTESWAKEIRSAAKGLIENAKLPLYVIGSSISKIHGFNEIIKQVTELTTYTPDSDYSYWNSPEEFVFCSMFEKIG